MFCRTGAASTTRSASASTMRSSAATSIACRRIAVSRTSLLSTPMTSEAGQTSLAASAIEPPTNPRPTMPILSNTGGCPSAGRPGWMTGSCCIADFRLMIDDLLRNFWNSNHQFAIINQQFPLRAPSAPRHRLQTDAAADRRRNDSQLRHQPVELRREHRLGAIAERVIGIAMHLDQQAVGAGRHRRTRHRRDLVAPPRSVAGIDDDRKMTELL